MLKESESDAILEKMRSFEILLESTIRRAVNRAHRGTDGRIGKRLINSYRSIYLEAR